MKRLTLIRHAETVANAAGIWQGQGDAGLSALGSDQAGALGRRLSDLDLGRVVASDLVRTAVTASVAGLTPTLDPAWREMDIGAWEGLTRDQVYERFPDEMAALADGEEVPMGGGESWPVFGARVRAAFDALVAAMHDGEHAVVLTHGGVIHSLVSSALGIRRRRGPWPLDRARNTAMTEVVVDDGRVEVHTYNDAGHLGATTDEGATLVGMIRHGESAANRSGEWHGRSDGPLSDEGHRQAAALAGRLTRPDRLITSPLQRARQTAAPIAAAHGLSAEIDRGFVEMDLGEWEGMTAERIAASHGEEWAAVFEHGSDLPRGTTGETFAEAARRGRAAVAGVADRHGGATVAVVTHGVLIRAIVSDVLGVPWPASRLLGIPRNASVSHLRFDTGPPILVEYNV